MEIAVIGSGNVGKALAGSFTRAVMARALEALALLNIMLQIRNNWPWQAGFKLVGPTG